MNKKLKMSTRSERVLLLACIFLISLGISVISIKYREYVPIIYEYPEYRILENDTWKDICRQSKYVFWNTTISDNCSFTDCIKRNGTRQGAFSYFVEENFIGITCQKKVIRFAETEMPQVALASYPGSGNTWFRHLIEQISGIATGSPYCGCVRETFIGECKNDTSREIVVKTHHRATEEYSANFDKAIFILRNPFDAILAEFNRHSSNKTSIASIEDFQTIWWRQMAGMIMPKHWQNHAISWLTLFKGPLHVVFYEDMNSNLPEELYKLASFLGVSVTFQDIWCADALREGNYHRIKPDWQDPSVLFTPQMKKSIRERIKILSYTYYDSKIEAANPLLKEFYTYYM